jgi:hypothetical protein
MKRTLLVAHIALAAVIVTAPGCETIAPSPRPAVDRRGVERVDRTRNEIQLRTTEAKVIVIKYDPATRVYSREREVGMEALLPRDLILVQLSKTSRGEPYADLIRLNDREETGSRR